MVVGFGSGVSDRLLEPFSGEVGSIPLLAFSACTQRFVGASMFGRFGGAIDGLAVPAPLEANKILIGFEPVLVF